MITVVLGRRGCGKTTLLKQYVESKPRLLIFDTLAEYGSSGVVFRSMPPLIDYVEQRQCTQFRAVFQPIDQDIERSIGYFLRIAWIAGNNTIILDEIDQIAAPTSVPDELAKNLRYGRHRSISVVAASRRAADVPRLITSQADELISFNQTEPRDIQYIEQYAGKDFARRTYILPKYEALIYRTFDGTVSKRNSRSADETIVSRRAATLPFGSPSPPPVEDPAPPVPEPTEPPVEIEETS